MADRALTLDNLERAYAEFTSYLALPIMNQRDKAGIIQAFEFTFELFWKTFQKLAPDAGLDAPTPRAALQAATKLDVIPAADAPHWIQMLRDRNLTSHVYRQEIAEEIFGRIRVDYARCFREAIEALKKLHAPKSDTDRR